MHSTEKIRNTPEPNWLKEVSPNSALSIRDLSDIFNIGRGTFEYLIAAEKFPAADFKLRKASKHFDAKGVLTSKRFWRVSTVRKYFKENRKNGNS